MPSTHHLLTSACACLLLLLTALNGVVVHCDAGDDHSSVEQRWHRITFDDCCSDVDAQGDVIEAQVHDHDDCSDRPLLEEPLPQHRERQHHQPASVVALLPQVLLRLPAIRTCRTKATRPRAPPDDCGGLSDLAYIRLLI